MRAVSPQGTFAVRFEGYEEEEEVPADGVQARPAAEAEEAEGYQGEARRRVHEPLAAWSH